MIFIEKIIKIESLRTDREKLLDKVLKNLESTSARALSLTNPYIPVPKRIDWKIAKQDVKLLLEELKE